MSNAIPGHPHGQCAADRDSSSNFMEMFASSIGRRPYFVQMSLSDEKKDRVGSRSYYWAKDVNVDYKVFEPDTRDVLVLSDVDYYMDIPELLAGYPQVVVMSTFTPSQVSKHTGEYTYTFDRDNQVCYSVSGGSKYTHKVWNYCDDVLVATRRPWWGLGLITKNVAYNVERKHVNADHSILLLVPFKSYLTFPLISLQTSCLQRLQIAKGNDLRMQIKTKGDLFVSTGRVGEFSCATVSVAVDELVAKAARSSKVRLTAGVIRTVTHKDDLSVLEAYILSEYHTGQQPWVGSIVYPQEEAILRYQFSVPDFDPNSRASMVAYMNPFMQGCYAPDVTFANELRSIEARVLELRTLKPEMTRTISRHMDEFVSMLIPEPRSLHPVSVDEVYARQPRRTQQSILDKACTTNDLSGPSICNTFMKKEPYDNIKPPRVITTYGPNTKLHYSRFLYSFSDHVMKVQPWYAFGKKPRNVAGKVANICMWSKVNVLATDLARMDGHVNETCRELESRAMMAAFHTDHHPDLLELQNKHHGNTTYSQRGIEFQSGPSRGSGGADTADCNTLDNAFMAFHAHRLWGRDPVDSWHLLGIYGGDDGLTPDIDPDIYVKACADMGQVLEVEEYKRGSEGVNFLSRIYSPYVWNGIPDSMCDFKRQMSKIHATPQLDATVTPSMKFAQKLAGLKYTDSNTPFISDLLEAASNVMLIEASDDDRLEKISPFSRKYLESELYPNIDHQSWMRPFILKQVPDWDEASFLDYIHEVTHQKRSILNPPLVALGKEPKTDITATVNGVIVAPTTPPTQSVFTPLYSTTGTPWAKDTNTGEQLAPSVDGVPNPVPSTKIPHPFNRGTIAKDKLPTFVAMLKTPDLAPSTPGPSSNAGKDEMKTPKTKPKGKSSG
jgi:hypothetical protein